MTSWLFSGRGLAAMRSVLDGLVGPPVPDIGVLVVGEDISAPFCEETIVAASAEAATLMIAVPPRATARHLIHRAAALRSHYWLRRVRLRSVSSTLDARQNRLGDAAL